MILILSILTIAGILASACFSGFENGMIQVREARLDHAVEQGSKRAKLIRFFLDNPAVMLGTILLGNNLSNVFTAIFFNALVKLQFVESGQEPSLALSFATSAALAIVVVIFGEVSPKVWFRQRPFYRCQIFVYPIYMFYRASAWVVRALSILAQWIDRQFLGGTRADDANLLQLRDDFRMLLRESEEDGLIAEDARELLENALEFHRLRVGDIMIDRNEVSAIAADMTLAEAVAYSTEKNLSRFPVYRDDASTQWIGVFSIYDAFFRAQEESWQSERVLDYIRPLVTISQNQAINHILPRSRASRSPMLIVVDDKKEQRGVVTSRSVISPLFADLRL